MCGSEGEGGLGGEEGISRGRCEEKKADLQSEQVNHAEHGGHFEKLMACVLVNHQEDIICKKGRQNAVICFSTVSHFENSCQHGGHFEK